MELMVVHPHIFWLSLGGLRWQPRCWAEMVICCGAAWQRDYRPGGLAGAAGLGVARGNVAILTLLAAWLWWKWLSRRVPNKSTAIVI